MDIEIKIIDREHSADINIPNEPFSLYGMFLPTYQDGVWSYSTVEFPEEEIGEMCFPDENYDYDGLSKNCVFVGAYDGENCVGLAILRHSWNHFMYLYDLKVNKAYRGKHVGALLIERSMEISREQGYRGLYTQGQDNNLAACLFYVRNGFVIGGMDTCVYRGTKQEGKSDVLFYKDQEA